MAKSKTRNYRSVDEKREIIAYAEQHGSSAANKKYKLGNSQISAFKRQLANKAAPTSTAMTVQSDANAALVERIRDLEEENQFLKKAVAYFSNEGVKR